MKRTILGLILVSLISILVSASVSHPTPITLNSGEKGKFNFAVDAALFSTNLQCTIEFEQKTPLEVTFDTKEINVEAGKRTFVQGEVKTPRDIQEGTHLETFCISCNPISPDAGTATKPRYCDIPISVSVIKTEQPLGIIEQPLEIIKQPVTLMLVIVNILLLVTTIIIFKRRKENIEF